MADADDVYAMCLQETNLLPATDSSSRINHLPVPDDWTVAGPSKAVTSSNREKGLLTLAHPSLAAHCPSSTAAAPIIKAVHEAVCDSFELLATVIGNVIIVNTYVHASVAPDYPALKDAIEAIPGFIEANVLVTGDF